MYIIIIIIIRGQLSGAPLGQQREHNYFNNNIIMMNLMIMNIMMLIMTT